jgi:hypothetical protein
MQLRLIRLLFLSFFLPGIISSARAADPDIAVPPALQPWIDWVREQTPELRCPLLKNERTCVWPGRLQLQLNDQGGTFHGSVLVDNRAEVLLPGGGDVWPLDVQIDSGGSRIAAVVLEHEGRPYVTVSPGRYALSGRFAWKNLPKALAVPEATGIVDLELNGVSVPAPKFTAGGELWLQRDEQTQEAEEDTLHVNVWRKLSDGLPFEVETRMELRVSGKARELHLGNVLLPGAQPLTIDSDLPYRLDQDWNLTLQVKPGVHHVTLHSVTAVPSAEYAMPAVRVEGWPQDETWVFAGDEAFRSVELSGAPGIDPNRTTLPDEWKSLPAFVLSPGVTLSLKETRRGERELPPNSLALSRHLWLDLDGRGYTIQDDISGQMNRDWRLNMQSPTVLTQAGVAGREQLITEDATNKLSGIELRSQNVGIRTVSRLDQALSEIPAVGWDYEMNSLSLDLSVGPGWTLLEAVGADNDAGTWLSSWRLWDIFFVCLMAIAGAKLLGRRWGAVAFVSLILCHQQLGAPVYIWINLLVGKALLDVLPPGKFRVLVQWYFVASFGLLLSVLLPFSIDQIRLGLFPQLTPSFQPGEIFSMIVGPTLLLGAAASFVAFLVCIFQRRFRYGFLLFLLAGGLVIASIATIALMSGMRAPYGAAEESYYDTATSAAVLPQSAPQELAAQAVSKGGVSRMKSFGRALEDAKDGKYETQQTLRKELLQVDPKAVVQTGVSVPSWHWRTWSLRWNGPVEKDRTLRLYLLSPRVNCILSFFRVLLLAALALAFVSRGAVRSIFQRLQPAVAVVLLGLFIPGAAQAQSFPGNDLLRELSTRLTKNICKSDCTAAESMLFELNGDDVSVDIRLSSDGPGAWPLPGPVEQFSPSSVLLDGEAVNEFRRTDDGLAWVRIPPGVHRLLLKGGFGRRTAVTLQLGLTPKHVEVHTADWTVDGLSPAGAAQDSIQFIRKGSAPEAKAEEGGVRDELQLADWYAVRRELDIALPWTATTTVRRLGQIDRSQILRVPLMPGESITGTAIRMESGAALVHFPRGVRDVSWTSSLNQEPTLELTAVADVPMSETWQVRCSAIWRCSFDGIPATSSIEQGENSLLWNPWPHDKLKISVRKPLGVSGKTETIDSVQLDWQPGTGLIQGNLHFSLRSAQGGFRKIQLPPGASLESVSIDNVQKTIALEGRELTLPLHPGNQQFLIHWRQPWELQPFTTMPGVNLGTESANITVSVNVPQKRWLLMVFGPAWGPAVLFWGELIVVVLFSLLLGRIGLEPLNSRQWLLLGLGMTTLHPAFLLLPALCFAALHIRKQRPSADRLRFNAGQIGLAALSVLTFAVLYLSIYNGLIVEPNMGISGNQSTNWLLHWYSDQAASSLPTPSLLSLPMWSWRVLMLVWASWLVFALLRWIIWGWRCFSDGGLWKAKPAQD